jgi:cytochrome b subunit of formate dehydrogenase
MCQKGSYFLHDMVRVVHIYGMFLSMTQVTSTISLSLRNSEGQKTKQRKKEKKKRKEKKRKKKEKKREEKKIKEKKK